MGIEHRAGMQAEEGARTAREAPASAVVRPLRSGDAGAVLAAFTASDDMARQGDVHDLASAERYVAWLMDADHRAFVVEHDGEPGALVALSLDASNRSAWMFYWTAPAHRGLGLASAGAATVADWALDAGGLERLELGYRANNPASAAVARHAGFVVEGRERGKFLIDGVRVDALLAARLRSDPGPSTPVLPRAGDWSTLPAQSQDAGLQ